MKNNCRNAGFTLIELLVVISIIAIIAAILFPVFAKVREKARQTDCLSNMKQIGLAFAQYSDDYDEKQPNGVNWFYPGGNGWAGQVYAYVKSSSVFICPDDSSLGHSSYAYNGNNTNPNTKTVDGYSVAKYSSPSKTVLLFEVVGNHNVAPDLFTIQTDDSTTDGTGGISPAGWGASNGQGLKYTSWVLNGAGNYFDASTLKAATGYFKNTTPADRPNFAAPTGRHTDGSNFLMADTHAKWLRGAAVTSGTTNPNASDCNSAQALDANAVPIAAGPDCSDSSVAATFSL